MSAIFLPLLNYALYECSGIRSKKIKTQLDIVFHNALRFITAYSYQRHHCMLYDRAELPSLYMRRGFNWSCFIYKSICGLTPCYLSLSRYNTNVCYNLVQMTCCILKLLRSEQSLNGWVGL